MTKTTQSLLNAVLKNAEMGLSSAHKLLEIVDDDAIAQHIRREITAFEDVSHRARAMLSASGCEPHPGGMMTKLSAKMGILMQTVNDHSARKAAEMLIEGNTIGATELTEAIRDSHCADAASLALAQRLRDAEREYAAELTSFL